jgi:hypothetical protein
MVTKQEQKREKPGRVEPKPVEDNVFLRLAQIAARIPPQELAKLPADGSKNIDHYVYGTPKEEA